MMAKSVYKTVIFGAGQIGQMTARLLSSPCQLLCFADNDPHKHGSYIGNIPVCSPDTAAALLPDLVILGVLDEERRNSMIKQMENLGYHGPFRDPSVLRMFDARVAVMRLLSEQIYQLDIPGNVAELGVFRGEFSSLISAAFPDRKIHLFDTFEGFSEKDITIEASGNLSRAKTGDFSSTDIDSVLHVMPDPTRTVIHKGWFPETFSEALRLAADLEEQRADLERKLSVARPKAILMDTICGNADELYGLNEAGRILGTSGAVLGALMDSLGDVYVKRKYTTVNRQFLKIFIDRGYGKNVVIGNGRNQAKFTFKGLCFAAVKLIAAGKIIASAIEYEPCREHVEREMKESKCLH